MTSSVAVLEAKIYG